MDSLLRRHARRKAASASSGSESARSASNDEKAASARAGGAHMDADEMNAYAEGALSEASRARYFSHLADCDDCRGLVTRLTLAAGVATAAGEPAITTAAAVSPARSWRDWLAALFSPPVLRYGVPAFALLAVMVIAFVALRERRQENLVAQNERNSQTTAATAPLNQDEQAVRPTTSTTTATVNSGAPNENANTAASDQRQANATPDTFQPDKQTAKREVDAETGNPVQQSEPKPAEPPRATPGADFGTQARDRDESATVAKAQQQPVLSAPAARPPADTERRGEEEDARSRKAGELSEKNKTARPATGVVNSGGVVQDGATESGPTAARRAQRSGTRDRAGRSNRSDDAPSNSDATAAAGPENKDDRTGETRSAGGRQFRRAGGAWVDTGYSSSRSITNVARSSEQYRALVADEPGIRAIADQLGGTVIIVWKNRAYRIY